jgi:CRISPR-associated protein Cmr1
LNSLEVTFRLLTPTFLRGFDYQRPELRVSSLKGCLRYWFRAIDPQYVQKEPELFGSSDKGQSPILFRLEQTNVAYETKPTLFSSRSFGYFGFSLKRNRQQKTHPYMKPNQSFSLQCVFRPGMEEKRKELLASIWMFGHVGSLGARARRGFGSLALESWTDSELPLLTHAKNVDEAITFFQQGLQTIYRWFPGEYSEKHTTFPPTTAFFVSNQGERFWETALQKAQTIVKNYRAQEKLSRLMFGLPLQIKKPVHVKVESTEAKRVSSPIYLRLWEINRRFYPVFFFLQAPFPRLDNGIAVLKRFDYQKARDNFATYLQSEGYLL